MPDTEHQVDHRAEAERAARAFTARMDNLSVVELLQLASIHSHLAIAQGQERVVEEIKAFRELMGRSYS